MLLVPILTVIAGLAGQSRSGAPPVDPALIRVFVHTEDSGHPSELAARQQSVKDLTAALAGKKKVLAIVPQEESADVVVEVRGLSVTVPKVAFGIPARPGEPAGGAAMARKVQLAVGVRPPPALDGEAFKNKNSPLESPLGWKQAADDIAKQIEKWIADRRAAIIAAR